MNALWTVLVAANIAILLATDPKSILPLLTSAGTDALTLCLNLCALYFFWLGIMEIVKQSGLIAKLSSLVKPIIDKLYGVSNEAARGYVALNLACNLVGVGSAATPAALSAIKETTYMTKEGKLPRFMAMLFVVNATSVQLLPTTVMSLRAAAGSANAADIMLPTIIATAVTTALGVVLTCLCFPVKND